MKKITQNSLSTTFSVSFDCIFTNGTSAGIRRIIQPFLMIWLGCFLLSILTAKVFAQGQYTIIRLPGPGCGGAAFGLNESGDVVGRFRVGASCSLADHAFLYHAGVMTDLESSFSSGPQSSAYGVNRRLQVVGSFHESPGFRPFLWQSGAMSDILPSGSIDAIAYGINDAGLVVGNFIGILNPRGFIYDSNDGTTTLIGTSSSFTNMRAVNSNGDIVGYFGPALSGPHHAFLMPRGASLIDLGTVGFFAGENSSAYAVNNRRDVVGTSDTPSGRSHAFLYSTGRMRDIDTLGSPNSVAFGINDDGTIVGRYRDGSGDRAFRYTDSDGMVALETLLPLPSFWRLTEARAINSAGQIVGWGYHFGNPSAFLMTPGSVYFQISQEVINLILAGDIGPITGQELVTDINQFRASIQQNDVGGACKVLASFDQTVNQQNGKDIDAKSAGLMLEQTEKMGSWLGCRLGSKQ